jgi:hypothetical protein
MVLNSLINDFNSLSRLFAPHKPDDSPVQPGVDATAARPAAEYQSTHDTVDLKLTAARKGWLPAVLAAAQGARPQKDQSLQVWSACTAAAAHALRQHEFCHSHTQYT